jgi:hypothetical protein
MDREQADRITAAASAGDALRISGELGGDAHFVRLEYIEVVLGSRATGGFFEPTRRNVARKFCDAWAAASGAETECPVYDCHNLLGREVHLDDDGDRICGECWHRAVDAALS